MIASILKWTIVFFATINFGFMAFDGIRGLTVGDYIRPSSGDHAGQLGPWSKVVESVGIDPESYLMKTLFAIWGFTGLIMVFCFAMNQPWAWKGLLITSISTLWYLVPGTALSLLQILLLVILRILR